MLVLNPQWQGCGGSDAVANGSRNLAAMFSSDPEVEVRVPASHPLASSDGVIGIDEQIGQVAWLLTQLDAARPKKIVHIAGDCGAELGPVGWLNEKCGGSLNLIWVDAHGDLNTPQSSPSGAFHGMVLRTLLGEGPPGLLNLVREAIDPARVQLVGVRALDHGERDFISSARLRTEAPEDVIASGPVYVHVDLDSIEPTEFGHVNFPEPGGIAISAVAGLLHRLIEDPGVDLVGVGLTESTAVEERHVRKIDAIVKVVDRFLSL